MKSVLERINQWESKNLREETPKNPISQNDMLNGTTYSNVNRISTNRQSVAIGQRLTEMEQAKKLLEAMQTKTNNSNLIPGSLPPRQSMARVSDQRDYRMSTNPNIKIKQPQDSAIVGSYEKQFLNIRGTLNMDARNDPPPPRNTVEINFDGSVVRPSQSREAIGLSSQNRNSNNLNPHGQYFGAMSTSQNRGLHPRTQKIISSLFGEEEYDQFGYSKNHPTDGILRMTNAAKSIDMSGIPKFRSEGIPPKGIIKNKNKRHHEDFDQL